jgi:hypothetical protein
VERHEKAHSLQTYLSSMEPQLPGFGRNAFPARARAAAALLEPPHLKFKWSKHYMLDTHRPRTGSIAKSRPLASFSCMNLHDLRGGNTDL